VEDSAAAMAEGRKGRTPLFTASAADAAEGAQLLLKAGSPVDHQDEHGWQPIHMAANSGSTAVLRLLLEEGASPNARGPDESMPLHWAARNGQTANVAALLEHPNLESDSSDHNGWTSLHLAAHFGHEPVVRLLLERVDPEPSDDTQWTPLHHAAQSNYATIASLLLSKNVNADAFTKAGWSALHIAASKGHSETVRVLLEKAEANLPIGDGDGRTPLHLAASSGHAETVRVLLAKADPTVTTKDGKTALHFAAENGHAEVTRALVEAGAPVSGLTKDGHTPLHIAVRNGDEEVVRSLNGFVDVLALDKAGRWPLQVALRADQHGVARILIEELGAPVDEPRQDEMSLLHLAALGGKESQVRLLLTAGANPNLPGLDGSTPLHLAAETGREAIVQLLLEQEDIYLHAREIGGTTPLHIAAERGHVGVVNLLLECEPMAKDACDDTGFSPLHLAAQAGHIEVVELLLEAHAHVDGRAEGVHLLAPMTPLQMAAAVGNEKVVAVLLQDGAALNSRVGAIVSALHLAIRNGQYGVALLLLDRGTGDAADSREERQTLKELYQFNRATRMRTGEPCSPAEAELARRLNFTPEPEDPRHQKDTGSAENRSEPTGTEKLGGVGFYPWDRARAELVTHVCETQPTIDGALKIDPERTQFSVQHLPWYENVRLLRLTDEGWPVPDLAIYFLVLDGNFYRLNGTSPPIHEVNRSAPIRLDESNILDYLRFFCFFVRGEQGPFHIAESLADPILPQQLDRPTLKVLKNTIRPAAFNGVDETDFFHCDAVVFYGHQLYDARFTIQPTGMIEMDEDAPVVDDLPVRVRAPIAYSEPAKD